MEDGMVVEIPRSILAGICESEKFATNETGQALEKPARFSLINSTRND
jgi:hypothetical protein